MRRNILAISSIIILFVFSQCDSDKWSDCIKGRGGLETETRNFSEPIRGIKLDTGGKLFIKPGTANEITIKAQENIIENIETEVNSGILRIEYDKCVKKYSSLRIDATIPVVQYLSIIGSGDIYAYDTIYTDNLEMEISGSGDIHLLTLPENSKYKTVLESTITGSGKIELLGQADYHHITITGSGDVEAFKLATDTTEILISGSGNCEVNVNKFLDVKISGSGNVYYIGDPEKDITITGSGNVHNENN